MMNSRPPNRNTALRWPFIGFLYMFACIVGSKRFLLRASLLVAVLTWSVLVASATTLTRPKTFQNVS